MRYPVDLLIVNVHVDRCSFLKKNDFPAFIESIVNCSYRPYQHWGYIPVLATAHKNEGVSIFIALLLSD